MSEPLTDEQLWGVPAEQLPERKKTRFYFDDFVDIYGEAEEMISEVKDGGSEEKRQF